MKPQGASLCMCTREKRNGVFLPNTVLCFYANVDALIPSSCPLHPASSHRLSLCHQSLDQYPSGASSSTRPLFLFFPLSIICIHICHWTLIYLQAHRQSEGITARLSAERDANSTGRNGRGDGKAGKKTWKHEPSGTTPQAAIKYKLPSVSKAFRM